MGGRGGSSHLRLGGARQALQNAINAGRTFLQNTLVALTREQMQNNYTDNGNPRLLEWQNMAQSVAGSFLHSIDRDTDMQQYQSSTNDPWPFYDLPQQKLILHIGLNAPPTIASEAEFNRYVSETGSTVLYRAWSGDNAFSRFKESPNSHVGNGIYGEGYYFAYDLETSSGYGPYLTKAALSPTARVIEVEKLREKISELEPRFRRALEHAGGGDTRTYGSNYGEAQLALKLGYNTIATDWSVIPLTRDAVVIFEGQIDSSGRTIRN